MLRRLVTGFGVALTAFCAMPASADTITSAPVTEGTWVSVKWFAGTSDAVRRQCLAEASQLYSGHDYECGIAGDTTRMRVEF